MYHINWLNGKKNPLSVYKSILLRQQLLNKKFDDSLRTRFKTFISILSLLLTIPLRIKKTKADYLILDSFIDPNQLDLRIDFIDFFDKKIQKNELVLANHKYFFYKKLSLRALFNTFKIWFKFLIISFLNILYKTNNYPTTFYYLVTANLINAALVEPKRIYLFQAYDTSVYLTALLLESKFSVFLSMSNSIIFPFNRYTYLKNTTTILCNPFQIDETADFTQRGWYTVKRTVLFGPEEILAHQLVPVVIPKIDIGLYSTGFWARNGLNRERDVTAVRNYKHINNKNYIRFLNILKIVISIQEETNISVKIYTHPLERGWFNEHNIKPPYWDLATQNNIEVDLSEGDSISKLYEVKMGISTMSTIMLDRWYHGLVSLILFESEKDKDYYHPKYFGKYQDNFYTSLTELKPLIIKKLDLK